MTRIVQLTDTHIMPPGQLAYGRVDTAAALATAVARIEALRDQVGEIDCVLLTGDLTDAGNPEDYAHLREILQGLTPPLAVIPGNHDRRDPLRGAFAELPGMPAEGPITWRRQIGAITLIGLDTSVPGSPHGALSEGCLGKLSDWIGAAGGGAVMVALHHPPFDTGIGYMDRQRLRDAAPLVDILGRHDGPLLVVSGHVHRVVLSGGPLPMAIGPSPAHAVTLDRRADRVPSFTMEPGGVLLHELRDGPVGPQIFSEFVPTGRFDGPHPFFPDG